MGLVIYTRRISRYIEGEYTKGFGRRIIGIWDSRGIFNKYNKRVWRRWWRNGKSGRVEKGRVERKNNRGVCLGV